MKESHEDLDRALRMLGHVRTPEGMEARIAGEMRRRQAEMVARTASGSQKSWAWWGFAAAVVAVAAFGLKMELKTRPKTVAPVQRARVEASVPPQPVLAVRHVDAVVPVHARRVRQQVREERVSLSAVAAPPQIAPPLPLTQQEKLLLALAHTPEAASGRVLTFMTTSETIKDHGLGKNTIFELDHQELQPMQSTLQGEKE